MTKNEKPDGNEPYPEPSTAEETAAQKTIVSRLYRMREVIAGLTALAEDGTISAAQIKNALRKAFQKNFS